MGSATKIALPVNNGADCVIGALDQFRVPSKPSISAGNTVRLGAFILISVFDGAPVAFGTAGAYLLWRRGANRSTGCSTRQTEREPEKQAKNVCRMTSIWSQLMKIQ